MPNIGVGGLIIILIAALILFGPNKLPELGRALGRALHEFKNASREIMEETLRPKDEQTQQTLQTQQEQQLQQVQQEQQPNEQHLVDAPKHRGANSSTEITSSDSSQPSTTVSNLSTVPGKPQDRRLPE